MVTPEILEQSFSIFLTTALLPNCWRILSRSSGKVRDRLSFDTLVTNIQSLEKRYDLKCENYDLLLWHLHNTSQLERIEVHSDFILFDKKKPLMNFFKSLSPEFYNDVAALLKEYQQEIKNVKRQRNISHLIYTFYTHWEGLVAQLQAKQEKNQGVDLKRFRRILSKILGIVFRT